MVRLRPVPAVGVAPIRVTFLLHGAVQGVWAAQIPAVRESLHLSAGDLGFALLLQVVGGLAALAFAGRLVRRHGAPAAIRVGLVSYVLVLLAIALTPSFAVLLGVMVLFGATGAVSDVAMNAYAVAVERELDRPVMSGLHGAWSAGSLAAAALAVAGATAGLGPSPLLVGAAVLLLAVAVPALVGVVALAEVPGPPTRRRPPLAPLLGLGALAALAMYAEGAGADWSGVYVHDVTGVAAGPAAVGYVGFAAAMVAGRLVGDAVVRVVGPVTTARVAAAVSVVGSAVVVAAVAAPMAVAGFVLLGAGLSVLVPLIFSAAGRHGGARDSGSAIATVSAMGHAGWLVAPVLVGQVAEFASLRVAFLTVALAGVALALAAGATAAGTTPKGGGEADDE
ncbi:MFS transporter [Micromonospora echinofusca]|uniref:MFS transporter n=1 Tax=Micromonospora echinofusca TaxID=47858 RepID=UPI000CB26A49|nr:MFS transporter [Micromonospora sp. MSM11]MCL7456115.1 MFS transporter [Micromonospora sp. MSM11]